MFFVKWRPRNEKQTHMCTKNEVSRSKNEEVSLRWVYPPLKELSEFVTNYVASLAKCYELCLLQTL